METTLETTLEGEVQMKATCKNGKWKADLVFHSPINLEYSSGLVNLSNKGKSEISVFIDTEEGTGHFEWCVDALGLYGSGTLAFEDKSLSGYDGVMCLPKQIIDCLIKLGYNCDYAL